MALLEWGAARLQVGFDSASAHNVYPAQLSALHAYTSEVYHRGVVPDVLQTRNAAK
jgi:hypothetical protein